MATTLVDLLNDERKQQLALLFTNIEKYCSEEVKALRFARTTLTKEVSMTSLKDKLELIFDLSISYLNINEDITVSDGYSFIVRYNDYSSSLNIHFELSSVEQTHAALNNEVSVTTDDEKIYVFSRHCEIMARLNYCFRLFGFSNATDDVINGESTVVSSSKTLSLGDLN